MRAELWQCKLCCPCLPYGWRTAHDLSHLPYGCGHCVCGVLHSPGKDAQTCGRIFCDLVMCCLPLEVGLTHKATRVGLDDPKGPFVPCFSWLL